LKLLNNNNIKPNTMKIETKFSVGDLVQHKFQRENDLASTDERARVSDLISFYEVMDIQATTCYAGTQVVYYVRAFNKLVFDVRGKEEKIFDFSPAHTREPIKLREDELKECQKDIVELLRKK
jgi:hypothetical protein